jgi:hypothetical protein
MGDSVHQGNIVSGEQAEGPQPTIAQILMGMQAHCLRCGTLHDGYTPCPGAASTPAGRARVDRPPVS